MKVVSLLIMLASSSAQPQPVSVPAPAACPTGDRFGRIDCGDPGIDIDEAACSQRGCCYDSQYPDAYHCFQPRILPLRTKHLVRKDCKNPEVRCKQTVIATALGEIDIANNHAQSTLAMESNSESGSVDAGFHVHKSLRTNGGESIGTSVLNSGAHAHAAMDKGIGAGVTLTVAEVEGRLGLDTPGLEWVGVGGKLGLSGDTSVSIGAKTELKVLGTGFTFSRKGASVCILGTCLSIG